MMMMKMKRFDEMMIAVDQVPINALQQHHLIIHLKSSHRPAAAAAAAEHSN